MLSNQSLFICFCNFAVFPYRSASIDQQYFTSKWLFACVDMLNPINKSLIKLLLFLQCFQKLIAICLSGGDDRDPSKTAVKASSAAILARILVMNSNYLAQLMSDQSTLLLLQKAGVSIKDNILLCLVDIWLDKVSSARISMIRMLAMIVEVSFCTSLVCVLF